MTGGFTPLVLPSISGDFALFVSRSPFGISAGFTPFTFVSPLDVAGGFTPLPLPFCGAGCLGPFAWPFAGAGGFTSLELPFADPGGGALAVLSPWVVGLARFLRLGCCR